MENFMKKFLIISLIVLVIALLTGTWILLGSAWCCYKLGDYLTVLSKIFNFFGWNKGIRL